VTHGCPVVIGGDINIHVEILSDVNAVCLFELLIAVDLQQHVTSPTHQDGGTLDLVITFNDFGIEELPVDPPVVVSDHSMITCGVSLHRPSPPSFARRVRTWRDVDTSSTVRSVGCRRLQSATTSCFRRTTTRYAASPTNSHPSALSSVDCDHCVRGLMPSAGLASQLSSSLTSLKTDTRPG